MHPPRIIPRGLKDLRTRSGAPDQTLVPCKAYMALTALEMEKSRRQTERRSLAFRLKNIGARLRWIETEKAAILGRLNQMPAGRSGAGRNWAATSAAAQPAGGFKFQY